MAKSVMVAWMFTAAFVLAGLIAVIVRPEHWDRTLALAVVLGAGSTIFAVKRGRSQQPSDS